jgi:hypothetical protein
MPESDGQRPSQPDLPHIELPGKALRQSYTYRGSGGRDSFARIQRNPVAHAAALRGQLERAKRDYDQQEWFSDTEHQVADHGLLLNVESEPGFELQVQSLERLRSGITLLNVRKKKNARGQRYVEAAIFVPYGKLHILENQVARYEQTASQEKPRNEKLLANIRSIRLAAVEALWTEDEPLPSLDENRWWEVWIRRPGEWEESFDAECQRLNLEISGRIVLPEHVVRLVKATRRQLESSLPVLNCLAEVRRPRVCSLRFTEMSGPEQRERVEQAIARVQWPGANAPAVCVLDCGVNRGHPLLSRLLEESDMFTLHQPSGTADHPNQPHGTQMAGIAAFGHLVALLDSPGVWPQRHRLESVKVLKNSGANDPELYGDLTRQAVLLPETQTQRRRAYCLAVTADPQHFDGSPTSWSAAVDSIIAGYEATEGAVRPEARLIFIAAGNWDDFINGYDYPATLHQNALLDPSQAWNALTVGAITHFVILQEGGQDAEQARAIAPAGGLSPTSRTSREWDSQWPYKPDIVFEGGNYARRLDGEIWPPDSLRILTTSPNFNTRSLTTFGDTSGATAQAARLGAILCARYPQYWPETIRGLIVHSARWNETMLAGTRPHDSGHQDEVRRILRTYGHGTPDLARAQFSLQNQTTLICENVIRPFAERGDGEQKRICTNELHLHQLPWPREVLAEAGNAEAVLRVTLSYFIEPNPGSRAVGKANPTRNRYRYASAALRFEVKPPAMSDTRFHAALNAEVEAEDDDLETEGFSDARWALGTQARRVGGSLHHDIWRGPAVDLSSMNQIAVLPIKGWWATRKFPVGHDCHNCHERTVRYSLIISIEVAAYINIYNTIQNLVAVPVTVRT